MNEVLYVGHVAPSGAHYAYRTKGRWLTPLLVSDVRPQAPEAFDFAWGNWSDGAEALAEAILRDAIRYEPLAKCAARDFTLAVVGHLPRCWCLSRAAVRDWFARSSRFTITAAPFDAMEGAPDA